MLIDDKGRIFGKLNIIDAFVLIFLFCIIPAFVIGYRIMRRPIIPRIMMLQSDYEKEINNYEERIKEFQSVIEKCNDLKIKIEEYNNLKIKMDKFLKKYPRLRKKFE